MNHPVNPTILHVVERPTDASTELDRAIVQAGFDADRVETVYEAMARLVRPINEMARAVIVCVDTLAAAELEFFTLAARRWPDVPLYIYGRSAEGHRQQRALALGARSEVTAARMAAVLGTLAQDQIAEVRVAPPSAHAEPAEAVEAQPTGPTSVPTPWRPASNRPQRTPPGSKDRLADDGDSERASHEAEPRRSSTGSLLSPQEVDALLSEDDVSEPSEEATHDRRA